MSGRRILHPLQPVANNQKLLVGPNGFIRFSKKGNVDENVNPSDSEVRKDKSIRAEPEVVQKKARVKKSGKTVEIEPRKQPESDKQAQPEEDLSVESEKVCQDEVADETSWMTSEVAPEGYWKTLAEERRLALEESLKENESIHSRLKVLEKENEKLKKALEEVIDEAKQLIEINEELTKELKS